MVGSFISDDLPALFASSEFGEVNATYDGSTVMGIFDDDDVEVVLGEGVTQIEPNPTFTGRTSDFTSVADGDSIIIRGETFTVKNWQREDVVITLYLSRN